MTILEALQAINSYPILTTALEVICLDNSLIATDEYSAAIGITEGFQLATADTLVWLSEHPSIVEQEVGINNAIAIKENMLARANKIYDKFNSDKFTGFKFGMIGENWNA